MLLYTELRAITFAGEKMIVMDGPKQMVEEELVVYLY
jgi:hypothetical protein